MFGIGFPEICLILLYFGIIGVVLVFILFLLWRFIKAFERIAGAVETIARK